MLLVKNYSVENFLSEYKLMSGGKRIINAGSSSVRHCATCVNVDIQGKNDVDVVCDIHQLPISSGAFDAIICNAVLQYCHSPNTVSGEFHRVLKEGGYLFVDAPWVQPYCPDTPDRFRFSEHALRSIFSNFKLIKMGPSIRPGSAFLMLGVHLAESLTGNRYMNYALGRIATLLLYPFRGIRTVNEGKGAGAFYMICQKDT